MPLGNLAMSFGTSVNELLRYVPLLLESGRFGFARRDRSTPETDGRSTVNRLLLERITAGHPFGFLSAPRVGSAVPFSLIDALLLKHSGKPADLRRLAAALRPLKGDKEGHSVIPFWRKLRCAGEAGVVVASTFSPVVPHHAGYAHRQRVAHRAGFPARA